MAAFQQVYPGDRPAPPRPGPCPELKHFKDKVREKLLGLENKKLLLFYHPFKA